MYEEEIEQLIEAENADGLADLGTRLFRDGAEETAFECYKAAAKLGNPVAMGNLGYCYQFGRGVRINYRLAAYCYEKAGEHGDARGWMNLGDFYYKGKGDIPKDPIRAAQCFQTACRMASEQAEPDLQLLAQTHYRMAVCKKNGAGVERNYEDAYEHYQIAAEALSETAAYGDPQAQRMLERAEAGMNECEEHF